MAQVPKGNRPIWLLLALHVTVIVAIGHPVYWFLDPFPVSREFYLLFGVGFAFVISVTHLIGLFFALFLRDSDTRIGAMTLFFMVSMPVGVMGWIPACLIGTGSLLSTALFLVLGRYLDCDLERSNEDSATGVEFQFSVRQMLITTFVVGVFLAIARAAEVSLYAASVLLSHAGLLIVGPLACWAGLSLNCNSLRTAIAILVMMLIAAPCLVVAVAGNSVDFLPPLILATSTLVLFGSFFVIRSCGYRLVPRRSPEFQ